MCILHGAMLIYSWTMSLFFCVNWRVIKAEINLTTKNMPFFVWLLKHFMKVLILILCPHKPSKLSSTKVTGSCGIIYPITIIYLIWGSLTIFVQYYSEAHIQLSISLKYLILMMTIDSVRLKLVIICIKEFNRV